MLSLLGNSARIFHSSVKKVVPTLHYAFSSQRQKGDNKNISMITYRIDAYRSATIDPDSLTEDPIEFEEGLLESLDHFTRAKLKGVWLRIDLDKSALIPVALKHGFTFHHAKPEYVLLSRWMPKDELNKLPRFASHFIGVGGVVINEEKDEILAIRERISLVGDLWKVPGGLIDYGEHISQAAEREVFEETGIKAKFQSILGFREKLKYKWEQPDIYFVCLLKPETFDIQIDPVEIKDAKWMKIDEYLSINEKIYTQTKIGDVLRLSTKNGAEKLKSLDTESLLSLVGFSGEQFTQEIEGGRQSSDNMFYSSNILKKLK